jgi:hypothetical protein
MPSYDLQVRSISYDPAGRPQDIRWDSVPSGTNLPTLDNAITAAGALPQFTAWRVMERGDDGFSYRQVLHDDPVPTPANPPRRAGIPRGPQ